MSQPGLHLCGDCCSGCNFGAKNTTLMNYLPDAAATARRIFCGAAVRSIEREPAAAGACRYQLLGLGRESLRRADEPTVVGATSWSSAAGTLGSTEILLRSRERGL